MYHKIINMERELEELKQEDLIIKRDIEKIRKELIDKPPEHFNKKDVLRAFIGAMFLGFSVAFSGNILNISSNLPFSHIKYIVLFTLVILTAEIYFIGYARVKDTDKRKFGQFWLKRLIAFYLVSIIVSLMITYIFGIVYLVKSIEEYIKLIIIISGPSSIGASISDLLKKY